MMFPFTKIGSFRVETPGPAEGHIDALEVALLDWLIRQRPRDIARVPRSIAFKAGVLRFASGWNILWPIGSGEIALAAEAGAIEVSYRLRLTELFVVTILVVILLLGQISVLKDIPITSDVIAGMAVLWFALFGGNYLIAPLRLSGALKEVARQTTGGTVV
jgi:hypothetical protein